MVTLDGEAGIFTDNFFDLLPGEPRHITLLPNTPARLGSSSITLANTSTLAPRSGISPIQNPQSKIQNPITPAQLKSALAALSVADTY